MHPLAGMIVFAKAKGNANKANSYNNAAASTF